jgi:hypothetical protein
LPQDSNKYEISFQDWQMLTEKQKQAFEKAILEGKLIVKPSSSIDTWIITAVNCKIEDII